jgi:glycosyltransferase involved in cell wall biosynthesis
MNILAVIHYPTFGGPHNRTMRIAPMLQASGVQTTVLTTSESGPGAEVLREAGIDVVTEPLGRLRRTGSLLTHARVAAGLARDVAMIRRVIRERKIDLVQVNGLPNPHAAIAGRLEGVAVVWHLLDLQTPVVAKEPLMLLVRALADVVMTAGHELARLHRGADSFGDRLVPFYPPVDTAQFAPDAARRSEARARLGIGPDDLLLGTVGHLVWPKRQDVLIRAAATLAPQFNNLRVRILGANVPTHDAYATRLHEMADRLGLTSDGVLKFVDPGPHVAGFMPAFDVFVMPSRSESVGTATLEAMACGLPVVATDVGSVSEIVADGETGFLVPPLDVPAVTRATRTLLGDPSLRERMGRAGRQRAEQEFSVAHCARTHLRAYEAALDHRRGRAT